MLFPFKASQYTWLVTCLIAFSQTSFADPLNGEKTIYLKDHDGQTTSIGKIIFTPNDSTITYTLKIDHKPFADYFLSMKEMKCIEGPELWCHLPYPYEQPRTVKQDDLDWLSHDLLFMFKKKSEFGANFWNGIYYALKTEGDTIIGTAQSVDLNELASPPDDLTTPPFNEFQRNEMNIKNRFLPFIEIK